MSVKLEMLTNIVSEAFVQSLEAIVPGADKDIDTIAIKMLSEIQKIVQDDTLSDFDAMEEIVCVFEKYNISAGVRHDFG